MKLEHGICPTCNGIDHRLSQSRIGQFMLRARNRLNVPGKSVALEMGVTAAYVCYLEQGKRNWSPSLITKYLAAIKRLSKL